MSRVMSRGYRFCLEKSRYLELRYFVLQYKQKKQSINNLCFIESVVNGRDAEGKAKLEKLKNEIRMIDMAAEASSGNLKGYILKSVTEDIGYNYLGVVPCGVHRFYECKRNFFIELDRLKQ